MRNANFSDVDDVTDVSHIHLRNKTQTHPDSSHIYKREPVAVVRGVLPIALSKQMLSLTKYYIDLSRCSINDECALLIMFRLLIILTCSVYIRKETICVSLDWLTHR